MCDCDMYAHKLEANPSLRSNLKKCDVLFTDNADGHHGEVIIVSSWSLKLNIIHRVSSIFQ